MPDPVTLGLLAAPAALNFLGGIFGESPEDQYKKAEDENIARVIAAIDREANIQRNRESRRASSNRRLAKQGGARRAAALGIAGDSDVYSNADVSNIDQMLNEAISRINENQQVNVLRAEAGRQSVPSYMFPDALDYLSSGLGAVGEYVADEEIAGLKSENSFDINDILEKMNTSSLGGRLSSKKPRVNYPGLGFEGATR